MARYGILFTTSQLVDFPTHTRGNTLDLVITNSPELVIGLEEEERLGRSDHMLMEMIIGVDNRPTREDGKEFVDWKQISVQFYSSYLF